MQPSIIPLAQLGLSAVNAAGSLGTALIRRAAASVTSAEGPAEPDPVKPSTERIAGYDVHEISPREFSELIEKLYDSGAISRAEFDELKRVRHELDADGFDPSEALDLLVIFKDKLARLGAEPVTDEASLRGNTSEEQNAEAALARQHVNWIYRLAAMQSGRSTSIDALA